MLADHNLPRPDVSDLLARMSRRRRARRRALYASTLPVVAVICAATLTGGAGGASSLKVSDNPSPTPTESTQQPIQDSPSPGPASASPSADATNAPSEATPSASSDPGNGPDTSPDPSPREQVPDEPVRYTFEPQAKDSATCGQYFAENTGPIQWCGVYPGATTFTAGTAAELPIEMCRGKLAQTVDAHPSPDGEWLNASVSQLDSNGNPVSGGPAWSWARPAPPASSITFTGGDCARWTISWAAVDDYAQPLAPGEYRLYVQFLTEDPTKPRDVLFLPVDITVTS